MAETHLDTLIVGAGFGGIYQLHKCLELGLTVKVIDLAGDVGGTWYWNRYPGCMSDTHSFLYRYSWDKEDLRTYPWSHHYVKQPNVLKYLEHVVEKHDLRKYMQFNTEMASADWDSDKSVWRVQVRTGEVYVVRYLVTALGLLSKQNVPDIPGIETFKGQITHTAAWDTKITWANKRVGVIGCGSTGTQVITAVAPDVKSLVCFQRHPQYSVPAENNPVEPEYRNKVNENYDEIFENAKNSATGFGFVEATRPCMSVSAEEREKIFQELWDQGNGFKFMFGGFGDIVTNEEANEEACKFVRKKISEIVKDPEKAKILTPHDYYARRPLCDSGYYQTFNRENVNLIDLKQTPITAITGEGIQTSDGKIHELDLIVFATGFEAIDGNYTRVIIRGRGGETIKDHWQNGPTGYLGLAIHGFPNMFMINGPQGPFANIPPSIEVSVDFISSAIEFSEKTAKEKGTAVVIEATQEAESEWNKICVDAVDGNLFKKMSSWIFGTNVPGSQYATKFYFGGLGKFRAYVAKAAADGYSGFEPFAS